MSGRNIPEKDQTIVSSEKFSIECEREKSGFALFSLRSMIGPKKKIPTILSQPNKINRDFETRVFPHFWLLTDMFFEFNGLL